MTDGLEIDHVFQFVEPDGPEAERLDQLGLRESYRRAHPGQGTANACYCFDNAYLELLWVTSAAEIGASSVARTGLAERAEWRRNGACPFGIALRGQVPLPFATWDYKPRYLPDGLTIPMALSSDDPAQPLLFRSPGNSRPEEWADGRADIRQQATGLTVIAAAEIGFPADVEPCAELIVLEQRDVLTLRRGGDSYSMALALSRHDSKVHSRLHLPHITLA